MAQRLVRQPESDPWVLQMQKTDFCKFSSDHNMHHDMQHQHKYTHHINKLNTRTHKRFLLKGLFTGHSAVPTEPLSVQGDKGPGTASCPMEMITRGSSP